MNNLKEKLILFTRYPVPGKAKTRLIPELGKEKAARLQRIMTGYAVLNARCCVAAFGADIEIRFDGASKRKIRRWLGKGLKYVPQRQGSLGRRMDRAFQKAFKTGLERVVIIGCDCPEIDTECLSSALNALKENDIAIGPAADGGYYLIGMRKPVPKLFTAIDWGSETVFEQTIKIAKSEGLKVFQLKKLSDVDQPQDLSICCNLGFFNSNSDTISVVIAALNEQAHIETSISSALQGALEVIVADGGSNDKTVELAHQAGASTLTVPYGRAAQFNTAAMKAKGDVLLFLHADTSLPQNYADDVLAIVKKTDIAAGAFSIGIDSDRPAFRRVEILTNLRSRLFQLPYGDQAIFVRKDIFLGMGGFSGLPIMEDYEFVMRLRRQGRVDTAGSKVCTSARRWLRLGIFRTAMINKFMITGYTLGLSPNRLAAFYHNRKRSYPKVNAKKKEPKNESAILRTK